MVNSNVFKKNRNHEIMIDDEEDEFTEIMIDDEEDEFIKEL